MLSVRIAARFLKKSPVQSALIVLGMSVGIAVQIFIGSLIASLQTYLIDTTLGSSPHLVVDSKNPEQPVVLDRTLINALRRNKDISIVLPQRNISAVVARGSLSTPLSIRCGDPDTLDEVYKISPKIKKGLYILGNDKVVVGTEFADKYNLSPGRSIFLTLAGKTVHKLTISGIADFGSKQLNETLAFSDDQFGEKALGVNPGEYSGIVIQLKDVFSSTADAAAIEAADKRVTVSDWQVEQKDLLSGLQAQSSSTLLIQVFIIIAVALGIASTLSISAIQKTRQIGILKALGLTDGRAGVVFLWQGLLLGVLGSAGGIALGLSLIGIFTLVTVDSPSAFPIAPQAGFVLISFLIGIGVAALSAILPSRRTARLDPIEVIQSGG